MARPCCSPSAASLTSKPCTHSRWHDSEVQLYASDILAPDGDDLRKLPLSLLKQKLERLLKLRAKGIFIASFEQGEVTPDLFAGACLGSTDWCRSGPIAPITPAGRRIG